MRSSIIEAHNLRYLFYAYPNIISSPSPGAKNNILSPFYPQTQ